MRNKFYFNLTLGSGLTDAQRLLDHSTFTTCHVVFFTAKSQFIPNLTSYRSLLIMYAFIFFKNISFIHNWPNGTTHTVCSTRPISVCEQF